MTTGQGLPAGPTLRVTEIYRSLSGESTRAGWPCTLVRLTGCGLRCRYCDTAYAFHGGTERALDDVLAEVRTLGDDLVLLTGGEPLEQPAAVPLLERLAAGGSITMVETGGHVDISVARAATTIVLDLKAPGSGMEGRNDWSNLDRLRPADEVKIVLASRADYEWARHVVRERTGGGRPLAEVCPVHFSPAHGELDATELAGWILADHLRVRLNLQLHRLVWPLAERGV